MHQRLLQCVDHLRRFGQVQHDRCHPDQIAQRLLIADLGIHQNVLDRHDTDNIIRVTVAHRQARAAAGAGLFQNGGGIIGQINQFHFAPWCHQRLGRAVRHPHHPGDHLSFIRLQHTGRLSLCHRQPDLGIGDLVGVSAGLTQQAQDQLARPIQQPDQRAGDPRHNRHHRCRLYRHRFGIAQSNLFGHQFPDDQRQIGDGHHHGADPQRVGPIVRNPGGKQGLCQPRPQCRTGKGP